MCSRYPYRDSYATVWSVVLNHMFFWQESISYMMYNKGIPNSNKVGSDNEVIRALAGTKIIIFRTCTKTLYGCLADQWTEKKLK